MSMASAARVNASLSTSLAPSEANVRIPSWPVVTITVFSSSRAKETVKSPSATRRTSRPSSVWTVTEPFACSASLRARSFNVAHVLSGSGGARTSVTSGSFDPLRT